MGFTVFYTKDYYNPYRSYPQNANRYAASKAFDTLEQAKEFAMIVKNPRIYNSIGKRCG